jgi:hypothetical protein
MRAEVSGKQVRTGSVFVDDTHRASLQLQCLSATRPPFSTRLHPQVKTFVFVALQTICNKVVCTARNMRTKEGTRTGKGESSGINPPSSR